MFVKAWQFRGNIWLHNVRKPILKIYNSNMHSDTCFFFCLTLNVSIASVSWPSIKLHNNKNNNRPSLSIATKRLTCLNNSRGVQLGTLAWYAVGPRFELRPQRACCAHFFLPPPFLPPWGDSFLHLPHHPRKSVRVIGHHSLGSTNSNRQKSYRDYL